ncbi:hypothetical protein, partial [Micromonospora sp. NPDC051296]|uniref:hypothetical protein n=1 Tax=Micromonospora sp. NPDC051296 TaxID=3155046 RepID=UPI003413D366
MGLETQQVRHSLTVLNRLAQRDPSFRADLVALIASDVRGLAPIALDVALESGEPMAQALCEVLLAHELDADVERTMVDRLPLDSPLTDLGLVLSTRAVARLAAGVELSPVRPAQVLIRHAEWLLRDDRTDDALAAAGRAKRIAADIVGGNGGLPYVFTKPTDLVLSVASVEARVLLRRGEPRYAIMSLTNARDVARQLAGTAAEYHPGFGEVLTLLAVALMDAGQVAEAMRAAGDAVDFWRAMVHEPDPDPDLARA